MKKNYISYLIILISIIIIAVSKILILKNGSSFWITLLFIIGFIILLNGINEYIIKTKDTDIIGLLLGKKEERILFLSVLIIYISIIFNIFNLKIVGVPGSILGIGLILYSIEIEKEEKLKVKITEKVKEDKKEINKKVNNVKNSYKKHKKYKKR